MVSHAVCSKLILDADVPSFTSDGHLLASSCTLMPKIDSTIVLIAGTGTVGLGGLSNPNVKV